MVAGSRAALVQDAAESMRTDGVARIRELFDPAMLEALRQRLYEARPELFDDPSSLSDKLSVGSGRYFFPLPLEPSEGAFDLMFAPPLLSFFEETLGAAWELEAY